MDQLVPRFGGREQQVAGLAEVRRVARRHVADTVDSTDYLPVQVGLRFSRNAANPSCASSVPELAAMTPPAWS